MPGAVPRATHLKHEDSRAVMAVAVARGRGFNLNLKTVYITIRAQLERFAIGHSPSSALKREYIFKSCSNPLVFALFELLPLSSFLALHCWILKVHFLIVVSHCNR